MSRLDRRSQMRSHRRPSIGMGAGGEGVRTAAPPAAEGDAAGGPCGRDVIPLCTISLHTCSSICFSLRASTSAALRDALESRGERDDAAGFAAGGGGKCGGRGIGCEEPCDRKCAKNGWRRHSEAVGRASGSARRLNGERKRDAKRKTQHTQQKIRELNASKTAHTALNGVCFFACLLVFPLTND